MLTKIKCPNCITELREIREDLLMCSECGFNISPNQKTIEELYAWVSVDSVTGFEGLIAVQEYGMAMPLVSSVLKNMELEEPEVRRACKVMKMKARLAHFSNKKILKEIE